MGTAKRSILPTRNQLRVSIIGNLYGDWRVEREDDESGKSSG
jgi:hypothetical protein